MIDLIFRAAESAVSPMHIVVTIAVSAVGSLIAALIVQSSRRVRVRHGGVVTFIVTQILWIAIVMAVRGHVREHRLGVITSTMVSIEVSHRRTPPDRVDIRTWREGLEMITNYPSYVGYYAVTADLLVKQGDYESAATLIEYGSDLIGEDPLPDELLSRLRDYYEVLPNRPDLTVDGTKYHRL